MLILHVVNPLGTFSVGEKKKNPQIQTFIKIRPVGAELSHAQGKTRHVETNNRFSQYRERA